MSHNIYLKCKDHSVSGEEFELRYNKEFDMLSTYPEPELIALGRYYESEEYISHTDSKKSIVDRIYQIVKNYTIGRKIHLLNSYCSEESVESNILDIGCGTGDFLMGCKNAQYNIIGIEPNEKARKLAESKLGSPVFLAVSELGRQKFDVITMWHVLEHVPNVAAYLNSLKALLKDNGTLIVAVPNFKSYDAKYYGKYWAAYDVPRHLSHFSKTAVSKLFLTVGLHVKKHIPMKFDSYYVSLLSEKYKSGSLKPLSAFFIGFVSNVKAKKSGEYSSLIYIIKKKEILI
jgi:2-polyprenyl-3-methyl-5-hydroxy-6-metoxy-1,4-benzoquinol methylase